MKKYSQVKQNPSVLLDAGRKFRFRWTTIPATPRAGVKLNPIPYERHAVSFSLACLTRSMKFVLVSVVEISTINVETRRF